MKFKKALSLLLSLAVIFGTVMPGTLATAAEDDIVIETTTPEETTQPTTVPVETSTGNAEGTTTPVETTDPATEPSTEPENTGCTECGQVDGHAESCSQYVIPASEVCSECGASEGHLESCSQYVAPETEPADENACNCVNPPENLANHADSCPRKQYILSLVRDEDGYSLSAQTIYDSWESYDEATKTDILNILEVYSQTTYDSLLRLISMGEAEQIEEIRKLMDSFVEIVEELPEVNDITTFDDAVQDYAEIHAIAELDSPLPADEVAEYNAAFDAFAVAMGHESGSVEISYPDTTLGKELKEEVISALEALDEAEERYASLNTSEISVYSEADNKATGSVVDLDENYAAAKEKLDAILAAKPELLENEAATVASTDHKVQSVAENIQINLFNYGPAINTQQNGQGLLTFVHSEGQYGWAVDSSGNRPLESSGGWPKINNVLNSTYKFPTVLEDKSNGLIKSGSLQYLFNPTYTTGRIDYNTYKSYLTGIVGGDTPYNYHSIYFPVENSDGSGTGLFQKDGNYFVYDSAKNAAWYNPTTQKFELYDYILRPAYTTYAQGSASSGNFLPFNQGHTQGREDYQSGTYVKNYTWNGTEYSTTVAKTETVSTKPSGATTAYRLYGNSAQTEVDLWFGMTVAFDFNQPKSGKKNNENMVFEFLGDDDVFVYIDDVLILDIGGTHGALSGKIDFATGKVTNPGGSGQYGNAGKTTSTLYELMKAALGNQLDDSQFIDADGDGVLDTFKDYTTHNLKFYYLERGGNISYCKLKFNMDPLPTGQVTLKKEVTGVNEALSDDQTYDFTVTAKDANNNAVNGMTYQIIDDTGAPGSTKTVSNNGTVQLKAGETAVFTNLTAGTTVSFTEKSNNKTDKTVWTLNGVNQNGNTVSTTITEGGNSTAAFVCTNTRKTASLTIEKKLEGNASELAKNDVYTLWVAIGGTLYTGRATKIAADGTTSSTIEFTAGNHNQVQLKAGEKIVIENVPTGVSYKVTEDIRKVTPSSNKYAYQWKDVVDKDGTTQKGPDYKNRWGEVANNGTTVTVTNTAYLLLGNLTITKSGVDNIDHNGIDEVQSNIFKITGPDGFEIQVVIVGNESVTIKDLYAGEYTVTEITDWSWRYEPTSNNCKVDVEGGETAKVNFTNARKKDKWLSGDCHAENWWGKNAVKKKEND